MLLLKENGNETYSYKCLVFFHLDFKYSMGISKFTDPDPLDHYTFLHRINTFEEKTILLFK